APFNSAKEISQTEMDAVKKLTGDNPAQQQRFKALEPLTASRLAFAERVIQLRREQGFEAAQKEIATGSGIKISSEMRKVIREMVDEENRLLVSRTEKAHNSAANIKLTILIGTAGAFVAFVVIGLQIVRNIAGPLR